VILLSARAGQEASVEGLSAGADDYLAKPFTAQELLARVRTHIKMARVRNELNIKLARANEELEAFSYSASHDLRAPVRAIDGFAAILEDGYGERLDDNGRRLLGVVRQQARRMGQLIEDLLQLSRVARGDLAPTRVDVSDLVRVLGEELEGKEPERKVTLVIQKGLIAEADPRFLRIVLENLLGNAWKFTVKTDEARIEVRTEHRNGTEAFVVCDNGVGFAINEAGRLFQPFQRLHTEQEFPGTGIGLAIVRRIVERHGGNVWAEGVPGRGASVFFTLPYSPR